MDDARFTKDMACLNGAGPDQCLDNLCNSLISWQDVFYQGVTFDLCEQRLWVRFRGDPIGNWRCAHGCFVFETDDGQLSIVRSDEQAVHRTVRAVTDYLG